MLSPPRKASLVILVLLSLSTLMAAGLVALTQVRQARTSSDAEKFGWRDSVVSLVFGFERQLMHFRGDLKAVLAAPGDPIDSQALVLPYELLVSRILLLESSSSLDPLRGAPEYAQLAQRLRELMRHGDVQVRAGMNRTQATAMAERIDQMMPDVQSYTLATARVSAQLIEQQFSTVRQQGIAVGTLAALHLLLLSLIGYVLWSRQKEQSNAHRQLELLADELREAKAAAEAASRSKSRFLANMSHELRTPFQGVLGMLQLLQQTSTTAQQRDLITTAHESARHLLELLNDVLDVSAVEAGKLTLREAALDLPQLCREVCDQMAGQAQARGLVLRMHMAPNLPQWVWGDATRLKQILFNLLGNAIKFTPQGEVTMDVSARDTGIHRQLIFRVADTGIGMDEQMQARLFRRFEIGDAERSRRFGGTGLGLEISRSLARMMRGDITARSTPGQGSVFEVAVVLPDCAAAPPSPQASATAAPTLAPKRILVADDHPINRKYLALLLRSLGHEVSLAEDGQQALDLVRRTPFDAALLDVHMPVLDGVDTVRAIRALSGPHADLPIVMLTADVMEETRENALRAGATAVLAKPLKIEQLAAVLGDPDAVTGSAATGGESASVLTTEEMDRLVAMFFADASGTIAELEAALALADPVLGAAAAHKLKGAAGLLGFTDVVQVTEEIGRCAQEGDGFQPEQLLGQLRTALDTARERARAPA